MKHGMMCWWNWGETHVSCGSLCDHRLRPDHHIVYPFFREESFLSEFSVTRPPTSGEMCFLVHWNKGINF